MNKILLTLLLAAATGLAQADTYDDLMKAVKTGDLGELTALFRKGVDVDTTDVEGNTLLMLAAREGNEPLTDLLLAQRPKVNARNSVGDSALRLAAFGGHLNIVKKLAIAGARINMPGWTATIYAAFNGHTEIVRYLLLMGAEVNAASENGSTALMVAARNGHTEVVRLLISARADVNKKNENGDTALDLAGKTPNNTEIVNLLKQAGGKSGKAG